MPSPVRSPVFGAATIVESGPISDNQISRQQTLNGQVHEKTEAYRGS